MRTGESAHSLFKRLTFLAIFLGSPLLWTLFSCVNGGNEANIGVESALRAADEAYLRWYTPEIEYYINPDGFEDFDPDELEEVVARCTQTWEEVGVGIQFVYMGYTDVKELADDDINVIYFIQDDEEWVGNHFSETAQGMTHRYMVEDEMIAFDLPFNDAAYYFTNSDVEISTDFANTLTHELGHVLGLEHTEVEEATMYYTSPRGEISKRTLAQDDIDKLDALYAEGWPVEEESGGFSCSMASAAPHDGKGVWNLWLLASALLYVAIRAMAVSRDHHSNPTE